jgi:ABC-2 type transport system permease protein
MVWVVALTALVGMYVAVYPTVKGSSSFVKLIDQMPKTYRALFTTGSAADFTTPAGYLNTELLTFMGPLLVLVYAIGAGASAVAGEEDRGTLDLLLANPISRARVLMEKFAALVVGVAVLMGALWLALLAEGRAAGMDVPLANSAAALLHMGLLGIEFGALALLAGSVVGHLGMARAVPAGVAVVAFLINAFAPLVSWLHPIRFVSPFYQYIGHDPMRSGLSPPAVAISVVSIGIVVFLAVEAFRRRDVLA